MSGIKNLKMIVGTAKTSHMLLLFTSVILISIGVYGTIVSKEYGCDNGISIKLNDDRLSNLFTPGDGKFIDCIEAAGDNQNKLDACLNDYGKGYFRCMEGGLMGLSITSIVIGVIMLLLSTYLLFM